MESFRSHGRETDIPDPDWASRRFFFHKEDRCLNSTLSQGTPEQFGPLSGNCPKNAAWRTSTTYHTSGGRRRWWSGHEWACWRTGEGAGGPAVEIQVRYPGAEPQLDIPEDLIGDSTKISLAHEDMEFGSGSWSGTGERSGRPVHESIKYNKRRKLDQSWISGGDLPSGSGPP